jgi:hypothetical protein
VRAQQHPSGERQHDDERNRGDENTPAVQEHFSHVAHRDNETVTCL